MELGCFLAGALLSTQGHMVTTEVIGCIEPIRDFLAIIFFASIGEIQQDDGRSKLCYHVTLLCHLYWLFPLVCLWDVAGLHVFPTFVLYELTILLVLTLTLVIMKVPHFSLFCSFFFSCSPLPHSQFLHFHHYRLFPPSLWWPYWFCQRSCLQALDTYGGSSQLGLRRSANSPSSWAAVLVGLASSLEKWVMAFLI